MCAEAKRSPVPSRPYKEQEGRGKVVPPVPEDTWSEPAGPRGRKIPEEFARTFWRLAVALQGKELRADAVDVYFEALNDLPLDVVTQAAQYLARNTRFFPTTGEWRDRAVGIHAAQLQARFKDWHVADCFGSTTNGDVTACGRSHSHAPHEFVTRERIID